MNGFLKGLIIGFSVAAPVGPIGILCLRRSLTEGRLAGFVSGLGAATADATYALIAALGLTAITQRLVAQKTWLQLGGGIFLLYLGAATLLARGSDRGRPGNRAGLAAAFASTFTLTFTNPMTILSFIGLFAGFGVAAFAGGVVVVGVFLGSAAWWLLLSVAANWFGRRLQKGGLRMVNVGSGLIIAGFGLWQLIQLLSARGSET